MCVQICACNANPADAAAQQQQPNLVPETPQAPAQPHAAARTAGGVYSSAEKHAAVRKAVLAERRESKGRNDGIKLKFHFNAQDQKKAKAAQRRAEGVAEKERGMRDHIAGKLAATQQQLTELEVQLRELRRAASCSAAKLAMLESELHAMAEETEAPEQRDTGRRGRELQQQLQGGGAVASGGRLLSGRSVRRAGADVLSIIFEKGKGSLEATEQLLRYISSGSKLASAVHKAAGAEQHPEAELALAVAADIKRAVTQLREDSKDGTCRSALRTILRACASGEHTEERSRRSTIPARAALVGTTASQMRQANADRREFDASGRISSCYTRRQQRACTSTSARGTAASSGCC